MIIKRTRTIVEEHEVTNEDLDQALFAMLNPTFDANWTEVYLQEAIELVRLAYENGYRLRTEEPERKTMTKKEAIQCKPEFFNPEQEGEEKYNQGWNDAIHHFINNIREFGEYDNIIQCDRE